MYLFVVLGGGSGKIHTPPAARLHESVYPSFSGDRGTICATFMGTFIISLKSHLKSLKTALRSFVTVTQPCVCFARAAHIWVKRPRPPGMPIAACSSVPAIFWYWSSAIRFVRDSVFIVFTIFSVFA